MCEEGVGIEFLYKTCKLAAGLFTRSKIMKSWAAYGAVALAILSAMLWCIDDHRQLPLVGESRMPIFVGVFCVGIWLVIFGHTVRYIKYHFQYVPIGGIFFLDTSLDRYKKTAEAQYIAVMLMSDGCWHTIPGASEQPVSSPRTVVCLVEDVAS